MNTATDSENTLYAAEDSLCNFATVPGEGNGARRTGEEVGERVEPGVVLLKCDFGLALAIARSSEKCEAQMAKVIGDFVNQVVPLDEDSKQRRSAFMRERLDWHGPGRWAGGTLASEHTT